jgi:hypothetical protein
MRADERLGRRHTALPLVAAVLGALLKLTASAGEVAAQEGLAAAAEWKLEEAPFLSLGGGGGEMNEAELFLWVTRVVRLPDGRVVVADHGSSEVRIFHATGAHQITLGGRGEGPGEFPGLWSLWVVGDTLLVEDVFSGVHVFSAGGEFVRRHPPRIVAGETRVQVRGFLRDLTMIGIHEDPSSERDLRAGIPLRLVRIHGSETRTLARFPGRPMVQRRADHAPSPIAYSPDTHVAVFPDRICAGHSSQMVIDCMGPDGEHLYRIQQEVTRRPVTGVERDAYFRWMREINAGAEEFLSVLPELTEFASHLPAFGRLLASDSGELWVGEAAPEELFGPASSPDRPMQWSVFSPVGALLARITLPERFRPMSAGPDWIAGVRKDPLDVEEVVMFRLRRDEQAPRPGEERRDHGSSMNRS